MSSFKAGEQHGPQLLHGSKTAVDGILISLRTYESCGYDTKEAMSIATVHSLIPCPAYVLSHPRNGHQYDDHGLRMRDWRGQLKHVAQEARTHLKIHLSLQLFYTVFELQPLAAEQRTKSIHGPQPNLKPTSTATMRFFATAALTVVAALSGHAVAEDCPSVPIEGSFKLSVVLKDGSATYATNVVQVSRGVPILNPVATSDQEFTWDA